MIFDCMLSMRYIMPKLLQEVVRNSASTCQAMSISCRYVRNKHLLCRPESRHGHLPMSHLGAQSPEAILPELPVLGTVDQAQLPHDSSSMSEQNSAQHGRVDSMEAAMGDCSSVGTQSAEGEGQMDDSHNSMPLVEAAAIGASSPGAFVRVPTSTALSQADQIALRYHNQASNRINKPACFCTASRNRLHEQQNYLGSLWLACLVIIHFITTSCTLQLVAVLMHLPAVASRDITSACVEKVNI